MYSKVFEKLLAEITNRDAQGIARTLGALVSSGAVSPGDKLPPIRSVATQLGVSTSTVAEAWSVMRDHGIIETDRRRGTTVRTLPKSGRSRYWRVPMDPGTLDLDLSTGTPDPLLLPRIEPILEKIHSDLEVTSYLDPPVLPALAEELRQRWPYEAPGLIVVDGANDGLDRIVRSIVRLGDTVIVEDPTYPLLLDILDLAGAQIVGVPLDEEGPSLDAVAEAMTSKPVAMVIQTGAHNPTGLSLTQGRADALARLLEGTNTVLIEDNHAGATADRPGVSAGAILPDQVFRVHSFSKTYGPDLRIAAMSGPTEAIKEIGERRQLGPGWTSRLIQRVLVEMLQSAEVDEQIALASQQYQHRRESLILALADRGIEVGDSHGLNIWVPVAREQLATVGLAARGIGVAPGEPFRVHSTNDHLRVTSAFVRDGFADVADAITRVATIDGSR